MKKACRKPFILVLCLALMAIALTACGKTETKGEITAQSYTASSNFELPKDVTNVSRLIVRDDTAYLCIRASSGESGSYIATMGLDGSDYTELTESLEGQLIDFALAGDNGIWAIGGPESEAVQLMQFDAEGTLIQSINLADILPTGTTVSSDVLAYLTIDGAGNLYVTVNYGTAYVYVFDQNGQYQHSLTGGFTPKTAVTTAEGSVAICDENGGGIAIIDSESQDLLENVLGIDTVSGLYGGSAYSFYVFDSANFYGYDMKAGNRTSFFKWSDLGLSTGNTHVCELLNGKFAALTGTFSQTGLYAYELTILEPGTDDRTVLTMTSLQPDDSVLEAVAQFNKTNPDYRVELTQYFPYYENVSDADWENAIQKFNLEIISGTIPDIIDLSNMPIEIYFKKGLLEDLYTYIDRDDTVDAADYFENVFEAFSIDGGLPFVTNGVCIQTVLANSSILGTKTGWSYDDLSSLFQQYDPSKLLGGVSSETFLQAIVRSDDSLIDWTAGTSTFESDAFKQVLALANQVGSGSANWGSVDDTVIASFETVMSVHQIASYNSAFAGNLNAIGLPNAEGDAEHAVSASTKIGMSATGENKEGAWMFVRSFLEEKQQNASYFFPIRKASFEPVMEEAMAGNSIWAWLYPDEITRQDVEIVRLLLSTANQSISSNQIVTDIVLEEAAAYFAGSRSADEVSGNIQNRIQTYMSEQG